MTIPLAGLSEYDQEMCSLRLDHLKRPAAPLLLLTRICQDSIHKQNTSFSTQNHASVIIPSNYPRYKGSANLWMKKMHHSS